MAPTAAYKRYELTESGISPRAMPGTPGYVHVVATDEHDDEGGLISDEFTNPTQAPGDAREAHAQDGRRAARASRRPRCSAPTDAEVTLLGWGSTEGVIREAIEQLAAEQGIVANNLQVKWLVPLHGDAIVDILSRSKKVIIVENNYSGQFARYLRSETSFVADGHIRKYDGEPFMPHHIVDGVKRDSGGHEHAVRARARDPGLSRRGTAT